MGFGRKDYDDKHLLAGIEADEPVFLLRAQDRAAAITVREYAHRLRLSGGPEDLIESAWAQAALMEAWHIKKTPDLLESKNIVTLTKDPNYDQNSELADWVKKHK